MWFGFENMLVSYADDATLLACKPFPLHPLHSELLNLFHPRRVMRGSLSINSLSFSPMMFHTSQYSRCFIPATTKLWNALPSMTVEATELQKFKLGANAFLLGVDGL